MATIEGGSETQVQNVSVRYFYKHANQIHSFQTEVNALDACYGYILSVFEYVSESVCWCV